MIITIKAPINILIYCDYDYSFICGYVIVITMTILIAIDTMYGVYTCICLCLSVYMSVVVIITVTNVDQWRTVNTTTTASTKISSITITTFFIIYSHTMQISEYTSERSKGLFCLDDGIILLSTV